MSSRIAYNSKEVELLARLIKAEALGEGQEGMLFFFFGINRSIK